MPKASPVVVLMDNFEDGDNTNLEDHAPLIGGTWVKKGDLVTIQSNTACPNGGAGGDPWYMIDAGVSKGVFEVAMNLDANDRQINLYCGYEDDLSEGFLVYTAPWIGNVRLYEVGGGGVKVNQSFSFSSGPQIWRVLMDGAQVVFSIDGVEVYSYQTSSLYGTNFGFELYTASQVAGTKVDGLVLIK